MEWRDNNWRDCYSDEHYLGTLLASKVPTSWQISSDNTAGLVLTTALRSACSSLCKQSTSPDSGSHPLPLSRLQRGMLVCRIRGRSFSSCCKCRAWITRQTALEEPHTRAGSGARRTPKPSARMISIQTSEHHNFQ